MKKIRMVGKETGTLEGIARFYLEPGGYGRKRHEFMDRERMKYIFTECLKYVKDRLLSEKVVDVLLAYHTNNGR